MDAHLFNSYQIFVIVHFTSYLLTQYFIILKPHTFILSVGILLELPAEPPKEKKKGKKKGKGKKGGGRSTSASSHKGGKKKKRKK